MTLMTFELTVDLQLDAAHGEQKKSRLGPSRPHEVADPELPFPDARRLRPGQRIFYAFVVHGDSPACRVHQCGWN